MEKPLHPFHVFPVHLFHESLPPIVANDAETEANARKDGYGETYVHQDYPKHVNHEDGSTTVLAGPEETPVEKPAPLRPVAKPESRT